MLKLTPLLCLLLAGCPQGTNVECFTIEGDHRAAWTTKEGCFEFRFPIEGGRVEVTGDVPEPLYCIIRPTGKKEQAVELAGPRDTRVRMKR